MPSRRGCAAPALDGSILWRRQFTNRVAAGAAIAPRSTTGATQGRAGFAEMRPRIMRPGARPEPSPGGAGAEDRCWAFPSSATSHNELAGQRLGIAAAHATHDASARDEAVGPERPAADRRGSPTDKQVRHVRRGSPNHGHTKQDDNAGRGVALVPPRQRPESHGATGRDDGDEAGHRQRRGH